MLLNVRIEFYLHFICILPMARNAAQFLGFILHFINSRNAALFSCVG